MARPVGLSPPPLDAARFLAAADLQDWIRQWLSWLAHERRASPHTVSAYASDLAAFLAFLAEHRGGAAALADLEALTPGDFRAFLAARATARLARSSSARALSVLRGFFRFLDRRGALKNAALAALRTPKLPKSLPRALSIEEAQDTLDEASAIAARAWEGKRNLAILMLLYGGGLRIGEALGLAAAQIEAADQPSLPHHRQDGDTGGRGVAGKKMGAASGIILAQHRRQRATANTEKF